MRRTACRGKRPASPIHWSTLTLHTRHDAPRFQPMLVNARLGDGYYASTVPLRTVPYAAGLYAIAATGRAEMCCARANECRSQVCWRETGGEFAERGERDASIRRRIRFVLLCDGENTASFVQR